MAINFPSSPALNDTYTDVTSGLTWTWNGSSWVSTPDEITLSTDTAGDYVESLVAGTGVTVSNNTGEAATPIVEIGQAVGTTDDVTFNTVTGTNGVITLTTSGAPTASATDGTLAVDTANNVLYIRSGGAWVEASGGASLTVSETDPSSPDEGDIWFESDTGSTYVYFDSVWVEIGASSGAVITDVSENEPANPVNGHIWFDSSTGRTYVYYEDGTSNQWVEIGATSPTASGADGYVQFAESGGLASSSNLSWNDSTNALSVTGTVSASSGLITATSSGTPTASLDDGALVLDTVNEVLYVRSNGAWIEASGGASVTVSDGTPSGPDTGDLWYESDTGSMFVYYDSSWVEVGGAGVVAMTTSSATPSGATNGDLWFDTDTAKTYVYYDDGTSTQWIEVGAASSGASGTDGSIQFATGGTFDSSASLVWDDVNSELEIEGHIIPGTTETYDLGSATNRFRDLYLSGTSINLGGVEISSDGTNLSLPPISNVSGDFTVDTDTLHVDSTNNRVGIGTTSPAYKLDAKGQVQIGADDNITPDANGNGHLMIDGAGYTGFASLDGTAMWVGHNSGGRSLYLATDETARLAITGGGNVGIGTTSPGSKLDVNGGTSSVSLRVNTTNADPALVLTTLGQQDWSIGVDYSDAGKLKFSESTDVGNTTRMAIDSSGRVTVPSQPSFDAYSPAKTGQSNVVVFGAVRHNVGNHYNTSNGRFTAPVAGRYLFRFSLLMGNPWSSGGYVRVLWRVNGTSSVSYGDTLTDGGGHTDYMGVQDTFIVNLNANDYIEVWNDGPIETYGTSYGAFAGWLLG
jgi:hypothetical protein